MAEIRSTLDIIMEKAKQVAVTEEDKAAFRRQELEAKIRGFVQRFQDGILPDDRLVEELKGIGIKEDPMVRDVFLDECFSRMAPEANNAPLVDLVRKAAGLPAKPLSAILKRYGDQTDQEKDRCMSEMMETLRERGISGSAVIPNLEANPLWANVRGKIKQDLLNDLTALKK